jgi:signal transduction histidine kinase/DNA-binding response OmpR family regulator
MQHLRILLLEDSPLDTELIQSNLNEGGIQCELVRVETQEQFQTALSELELDLILADYSLPSFDGIAALDLAHQQCPEIPFIFVSATLGEELAIETLKRGATDYVLKQRLGRLVPSVQRALRESKERSERQRAEAALQQSEVLSRARAAELEAFLEITPVAVWIAHDPHCQTMTANRTAYEFMRMEPGSGAVTAPPANNAYPFPFRLRRNGQDIPIEELSMRKAGRTGESVEEEAELVFEDGFVRHIYGRAVPLRDEQNQVRGVIGAYVDVSDRKQAEEQIRKQSVHAQILAEISQAFSETILDFQSVLETTAQYIANLIGDGCTIRLLSDNGQWLNLAAIHHRNPEALTLLEELLESRKPANEGIYAQVFEIGEPLLVTITSPEELQSCLSPKATPYLEQVGIASFVIAPLCVRGRAVGTLGMFRDRGGESYTVEDQNFLQSLSDRIALGIDNARLYQESQRANRVKDEFLAMLSHELRSPLNAILGWAKLLCSRQFDPETTTRALQTIERNARLQTQLIGDLLDVSRILRGKLNLEVLPVNLVSPIEAAIETMRLAAEGKSIHLETTIEPNIRLVMGDPGRLQQVVWNLLSNAIKFTPEGGRIEIRLDSVGNQARIQVQDTGKGISSDFLPYIFEYFRQADSSMTRTQGGLGLGLAIVHHLVELHGGTVSAESPGEGQGSTFTVLIPFQKRDSRDDEPENPEAAENSCASSTLDLQELRIVLVDDELDTREFLSFLLRQHNAEVQSFDAADSAFAAFAELPADILISDLGMPQEDGYSLIRRIRELPADQGGTVPAIALTAYAREEDRQKALDAGFQFHLAKPVNSSELIKIILHLTTDQS